MTLRTLHLYGELAKTYGYSHRVAAGTLPEALRIVECNHPGFLIRVRHGQFHCAHGHKTLERAGEIQPHQLFLTRSEGDWHLVPVAAGGKGRTGKMIFSIVVGGALLATGVGGALAGSAAAGAGGATGTAALSAGFAGSAFAGISYGTLTLMGAGLFLGGLNQLLTPVPKGDTGDKKPTSFTFDGPGNIDNEGGAVPIILGEVIFGGVTIASSIDSSATITAPGTKGVSITDGRAAIGGNAFTNGGVFSAVYQNILAR